MFRLFSILAQASGSSSQLVPGVDYVFSTADKLEKMSDRWLFLAAMMVILVSFSIIIRYLVKDREQSRIEHAQQLKDAYNEAALARKEHAQTMKEMYGEQTKLAAQLLVALQENNVLIARMEKLIDSKT